MWAKISYLTLGSGPAVIVIPGALSMAADYVAFGSALAEHHSVHIIERRGRGLSSPQGADYSIRKEQEDVLALQQTDRRVSARWSQLRWTGGPGSGPQQPVAH